MNIRDTQFHLPLSTLNKADGLGVFTNGPSALVSYKVVKIKNQASKIEQKRQILTGALCS